MQTSNGEEQRLYTLYTPAFRNPVVTGAEVEITGMKTWPELMGYVGLWLKAETTQPDLWAEMEQAPDISLRKNYYLKMPSLPPKSSC